MLTVHSSFILIYSELNFPHTNLDSDHLGVITSGILKTVYFHFIDSFSYFNFFQLNQIPNAFSDLLDIIFLNTTKPSVSIAMPYLVSPDPY